jgi:hypothetical protein
MKQALFISLLLFNIIAAAQTRVSGVVKDEAGDCLFPLPMWYS